MMDGFAERVYDSIVNRKPRALFSVLDELKSHANEQSFEYDKDFSAFWRMFPIIEDFKGIEFLNIKMHEGTLRGMVDYPLSIELHVSMDRLNESLVSNLGDVLSDMNAMLVASPERDDYDPQLHYPSARKDIIEWYQPMVGVIDGNRYKLRLAGSGSMGVLCVLYKIMPPFTSEISEGIEQVKGSHREIDLGIEQIKGAIANTSEGIETIRRLNRDIDEGIISIGADQNRMWGEIANIRKRLAKKNK